MKYGDVHACGSERCDWYHLLHVQVVLRVKLITGDWSSNPKSYKDSSSNYRRSKQVWAALTVVLVAWLRREAHTHTHTDNSFSTQVHPANLKARLKFALTVCVHTRSPFSFQIHSQETTFVSARCRPFICLVSSCCAFRSPPRDPRTEMAVVKGGLLSSSSLRGTKSSFFVWGSNCENIRITHFSQWLNKDSWNHSYVLKLISVETVCL